MDLKEIGWEGMDWNHLGQEKNNLRAVVNAVMILEVL